MEKKELPVEVKQNIWFEAEKYTEDKVKAINEEHFNVYNAWIEGATAYATKLIEAEEKIKVLDYDNKRLSSALEGCKEAVEELKKEKEYLESECKRMSEVIFKLSPLKRKDIDDL